LHLNLLKNRFAHEDEQKSRFLTPYAGLNTLPQHLHFRADLSTPDSRKFDSLALFRFVAILHASEQCRLRQLLL
jgi:hypothetical protein